jgi:DNA-directed RNA polymerase specialized sigma24 family protein
MGNEEKNLKECSDIFKKRQDMILMIIIKNNKPKLIWLLMKFTKDKEVAEDFVQEAFIQSLNKIDLYNNEYAYITWLSRIAQILL